MSIGPGADEQIPDEPSGPVVSALRLFNGPISRFLRFLAVLDSCAAGGRIGFSFCSCSEPVLAKPLFSNASGAEVTLSAFWSTAALAMTGELDDCELTAPINWEFGLGVDPSPSFRFRLLDNCSILT